MIRASLRLLVLFALVWFVSANWDGGYALVERGLGLLKPSIVALAGNGTAGALLLFGVAAVLWMLPQLPFWVSAVRVDKLRGPRVHPFARLPLRKHLRFRPARFIGLMVFQLLGLLLLLRSLPVVFEPAAARLPSWLAVTAGLSDTDTWVFYGLLHLVVILVAWVFLLAISELFGGRKPNSVGFYRYQFDQAPVSRMMVRIVGAGLFPVAAFAATSHAHPMHGLVVFAYLAGLVVIVGLAQLITFVLEGRNEAWLASLDAGYSDNEAVAGLRDRTIRFLHPGLATVPPPVDAWAPEDEVGADADAVNDDPAQAESLQPVPLPASRSMQAAGSPVTASSTVLPDVERWQEPLATADSMPAGADDESVDQPASRRRWFGGYRYWMFAMSAMILFGVLSFAWQWLVLPSTEQTRVLAESAHVHVRRAEGAPLRVELLGTRYDYSLNTSLENVSKHFINAVIASEDHRFFDHGVTYKLSKFAQAAVRCAWRALNIFAGSRACRGNSTIGQQLARNLFISEERSLLRKFKELVWSIKMEFGLSKQEILQAYVNRIYLGKSNFGVEMAARSYFGKSSSQLTLHEAALLAAAVKRPSWNWHQDKTGAMGRARTIMLVMRRYGFAPATARFPKTFVPRPGRRELRKPYLGHLWQWIKRDVEQVMADLPPGEYKLLTTLNAEVQVYARRRLSEAVRRMQAKGVNVSQAAAVVMRPNGAVLSMVGGIGDDLTGRGTNRAKRTDGLYARPPASAFKPVVYLAALENGVQPESEVNAGPVSIAVPGSPNYEPLNHDGKTYDRLSMRDALVKSVNTATVHLLEKNVGFDHLFNVADRLGIDSSGFKRQWGMALGQGGVPLVTMAGAYAAFANGGYRVTPHAFIAVTNEDGRTIWRRGRPRNKRMFSNRVMRNLNGMLEEAVRSGTGIRARRGFEPTARIAGKTGTGDGFVDAWFIGYTADVVIAIWLGNDRPIAMRNTFGGGPPAGVFNSLLHDLVKHTDLVSLDKPIP